MKSAFQQENQLNFVVELIKIFFVLMGLLIVLHILDYES